MEYYYEPFCLSGNEEKIFIISDVRCIAMNEDEQIKKNERRRRDFIRKGKPYGGARHVELQKGEGPP